MGRASPKVDFYKNKKNNKQSEVSQEKEKDRAPTDV